MTMPCTHLFDNLIIRDVPKIGVRFGGRYGRERLSASLLTLPATWDAVDFTLARSVYSAVSCICCCPSVDTVDVLLNQPSEGVLSPFASWHGCGGYLLGF